MYGFTPALQFWTEQTDGGCQLHQAKKPSIVTKTDGYK